jgi:hypothetical protein
MSYKDHACVSQFVKRHIPRILFPLFALFITAGSVVGQVKTAADPNVAAAKTIAELGGRFCSADQFVLTKKIYLFRFPYVNPLDPYGVMSPLKQDETTRPEIDKDLRKGDPRNDILQIDLSGTKPTDEDLSRLAALKHVRVLLLNGAPLRDNSLRHLAGMTQLEVLDLCDTGVTSAGLAHLANLTNLNELHLNRTKVDDYGMRYLANMSKLTELSISDSPVGDRGLGLLVVSTKLKTIEIENTAVTAEAVEQFRLAHPQCYVIGDLWLNLLQPPPEKSDDLLEEWKEPRWVYNPNRLDGNVVPTDKYKRNTDAIFVAEHKLPTGLDEKPSVERIFDWNGLIVADCVKRQMYLVKEKRQLEEKHWFFQIDVEGAKWTQLQLPEMDEILHLAVIGPSEPVALCMRKGQKVLYVKNQEGWASQTVPEQAGNTNILVMAADDRDLILLGQEDYFWRRDGKWTVRKFADSDHWNNITYGTILHSLIVNGSLYQTVGRGEFGGGLYRLDLQTGQWEPGKTENIRNYNLPINDIKLDPLGRIVAVEGLHHMTGIEGAIWVRQADKWENIVAIENFQRRLTGWNLGYTALRAVDFDSQGRMCVLAGNYGICRYEGRSWNALGPWNTGGSAFHFIGSNRAVIGTYEDGIVLCRLVVNEDGKDKNSSKPPTVVDR